MTVIKCSPAVSLEDFLKLPETKPASEYIDDRIIQKTMPKARHSRLQAKLTSAINEVTESKRIAYTFPELRCTFGDRSTVPDIAVLGVAELGYDLPSPRPRLRLWLPSPKLGRGAGGEG
jgi:Uma2 family endonuclease